MSRVAFAAAEPDADYVRANAIRLNEAGDIPSAVLTRLSGYRVITVGEIHGTREAPELFGKLVRGMASRGMRITVALEIQSSNQRGLDRFVRTGDVAVLRSLAHFTRDAQDGRSSQAMAALIQELSREKSVSLLAFDPDVSSGGQDRDTRMAQYLVESAQKRPDDLLMVLTGNLHSAAKVGNMIGPDYRPMAYEMGHLPGTTIRPEQIFAVKVRWESGSFWGQVNGVCGIHSFSPQIGIYVNAVPWFSYFLPERIITDDGHDGTVFIRQLSPSRPFIEE